MTLLFSVTLVLSVLGLVTLLSIKRYEMRTGRMLFNSIRPRVRVGIHATVLFVEYILPFLARRSLAKAWVLARAALLYAIARSALFIEETLQRILRGVEETMQPRQSTGPASAFLQEVAEHKRKLLRKPVERRAIFEKYR